MEKKINIRLLVLVVALVFIVILSGCVEVKEKTQNLPCENIIDSHEKDRCYLEELIPYAIEQGDEELCFQIPKNVYIDKSYYDLEYLRDKCFYSVLEAKNINPMCAIPVKFSRGYPVYTAIKSNCSFNIEQGKNQIKNCPKLKNSNLCHFYFAVALRDEELCFYVPEDTGCDEYYAGIRYFRDICFYSVLEQKNMSPICAEPELSKGYPLYGRFGNNCSFNIEQGKNQVKNCPKLSRSSYCYLYFAMVLDDTSICYLINNTDKGSRRWRCLKHFAVKNNDVSLCGEIMPEGKFHQMYWYSKWECYFDLAVKNNDSTLCEKINPEATYSPLASGGKGGGYLGPNTKNYCYYTLAAQTLNKTLCSYIDNSVIKKWSEYNETNCLKQIGGVKQQ